MARRGQLELLGQPAESQWLDLYRQRIARWAGRGVFFGTSSWKYAGWLGQVYERSRYLTRGKFSAPRFERECLGEYAETFPTVCGDFSFYQFYGAEFWDRLFAQVPAGFQFGFKAPEQITARQFPRHERYGAVAGMVNDRFLDAELFAEKFLGPLTPYRDRVGYVVLEFAQMHGATPAGNAAFLEWLDKFLAQVPAGWRVGVEIRTPSLLGPAYFECLARRGVTHVFNSWTAMPGVGEQLAQVGVMPAGFGICRALLRPGRSYAAAVKTFQPYAEIRDPFPEGYREVAALVQRARRPLFVAVNNRYAGNAVKTIEAILDECDAAESG